MEAAFFEKNFDKLENDIIDETSDGEYDDDDDEDDDSSTSASDSSC